MPHEEFASEGAARHLAVASGNAYGRRTVSTPSSVVR